MADNTGSAVCAAVSADAGPLGAAGAAGGSEAGGLGVPGAGVPGVLGAGSPDGVSGARDPNGFPTTVLVLHGTRPCNS